MQLVTLNCNQCGGPLEVAESANFVTCNHCQAQLAVKRTPSATYTEQLDAIEARQDQMLAKLHRLEQDSLLAECDREWAAERRKYLTSRKGGEPQEPSEGDFVGAGIFLFVGIVVMGIGFASSSPAVIIGLIIAGIALMNGMHIHSNLQEFQVARQRYLKRRKAISN